MDPTTSQVDSNPKTPPSIPNRPPWLIKKAEVMKQIGQEVLAQSNIQSSTVPLLIGSVPENAKPMQFEFKDGNTTYGTEKAQKISTLGNKCVSLDTSDTLESRGKNFVQRSSEDWISSGFVREQLNQGVPIRDAVLTAPVNLRYQSLEVDNEKKCGFCRLGVITDPRNGFTNLRELKKFANEFSTAGEKVVQLDGQQKLIKDKNSKQYQSLEFAIKQLSPENVKQALQERRYILQQQMLRLVQTQIEQNKGSENEKELNMTHVALLNPKKKDFDKSGWMHDEENEIIDMQEIFSECDGKEVFLDGSDPPKVDDKGNLHLSLKNESNSSMKLNANFFNIPVQGHSTQSVTNFEKKYEVNTTALKKLNEAFEQLPLEKQTETLKKEIASIKKRLDAGKSDYQLAEDVSVLLLKMGQKLSMGCLSAKDRTGYVASRTDARMLGETIDKKSDLTASKKHRLKEKFGAMAFDEHGVAARIVEANTGVKTLKVSPFKLPGLTDTIPLKLKRVWAWIKSGISLLKD